MGVYGNESKWEEQERSKREKTVVNGSNERVNGSKWEFMGVKRN
jgi:hypothetical protein